MDPLLERAKLEPGAADDTYLLAFVLGQRAGVLCVQVLDDGDPQHPSGVHPMPPHVVGVVDRGPLSAQGKTYRPNGDGGDGEALCARWTSPPFGGEPVAGLVSTVSQAQPPGSFRWADT